MIGTSGLALLLPGSWELAVIRNLVWFILLGFFFLGGGGGEYI